MIHLISIILSLYIIFRLIVPLAASLPVKILSGLLVVLISFKHFLFQYVFGGLSAPDLSFLTITVTGWLFVTLILLFFFLVVKDIIILVLRFSSKAGLSFSLPFSQNTVLIGIVIFAFVCSSLGLWGAIKTPDVNRMEIVFPDLPKELDGLSIVQITDLHASTFNPENKVRAIVAKVNQLQPDLILITGDIYDGPVSTCVKNIAPLQDLKATYGVYGSAGNHEYYSGFDAWQQALSDLGIRMLYNQHDVVSIKGKNIVIAGITDPVATQFARKPPDIDSALRDAPENAFRILMAHRPSDASKNADRNIHLQLSGHTHGGQIIGINLIVRLFNQNRLSGWYDVGTMKMYVSTGISLWNGFPARLGVPSEIPYLILRSDQK